MNIYKPEKSVSYSMSAKLTGLTDTEERTDLVICRVRLARRLKAKSFVKLTSRVCMYNRTVSLLLHILTRITVVQNLPHYPFLLTYCSFSDVFSLSVRDIGHQDKGEYVCQVTMTTFFFCKRTMIRFIMFAR